AGTVRCVRRPGRRHLSRSYKPIQQNGRSTPMISFGILVSFLTLADFSNFTYCRENSRGLYELQCVQLDANAKGEVKFKRREAEQVKVLIKLPRPAGVRFFAGLESPN